MNWWETVLHALWLFLPAYVANMAPVFVAKLIPGWTAPIDGGRMAKDGQRVLGPGKTWRGLVGGALVAGGAAVCLAWLAPHWNTMAGWDWGLHGYTPGSAIGAPVYCPTETFAGGCQRSTWWQVGLFGTFVGLMALVGDFVKSYFKRRRKIARGRPWFPFDQLDFVVFGLLGMEIAAPLLPTGWVHHALLDDWAVLATLLILTPALHLLVNRVGYWLGLKEVPW